MEGVFKKVKPYFIHFTLIFIAQVIWYIVILRQSVGDVWLDILVISCIYAFVWWLFDRSFAKRNKNPEEQKLP